MSTVENIDNKKRIDKYIEEHDCQQKDYEPVFVRGKKKILTVYSLPTEFLYYNINNGRFAAEYREIVRQEGGLLDPHDPKDAKKIQNLLLSLDPAQTKLDKNDFLEVEQRQAGIITVDGYVIDGNRRLSLITSLFEETQEERWEYMNVARLTEPLEKEDLWRLEGGIQLGKEQQQKYGPINTMLKIKEGKDAGLSNKQTANALYGVKEKEVEQILDRLRLIENYLLFNNKEQQYSIADGKDSHFVELQHILANTKQRGYDHDKITDIKHAAFQLIREGKTHQEIRKINQAIDAELISAVDEIIDAGGKIEPSQDMPEKKSGLQNYVDKVVDDDTKDGEESDEREEEGDDGELTETDTHFQNLLDELNVHKNKNHISLLLKSAERNLKGIDVEGNEFGEEIRKPETKSIIQKISYHLQKLQKKIDG